MTINTWASFSKRRNSTKQPTGGTQKTVTLKSPTSLINPVFLLENFSLSDNYLQWGDRYYFIDDIILVNNGLAEYHCSVDALASWKSSIGSMTEYVLRSASSYDGALIDTAYPTKNYYNQTTTSLSGFASAFNLTGTYVVGVIGAAGASNAIDYYALSASEFNNLCDFMFGDTWLDQNETDIAIITQKELVNPFQYIASARWYPFTISDGMPTFIKFGFWTSTVTGKLLSTRRYIVGTGVNLPTHPDAASRGAYLNGSPFTSHTLYLYNFCQLDIDADYFTADHAILIDIDIDYWAGTGLVRVVRDTGSRLLYEIPCEVGTEVILGQTGTGTLSNAGLQMSVQDKGIVGAISGAISIIGQSIGVLSSLFNKSNQTQIVGAQGSAVAYAYTPRIETRFRIQAGEDLAQIGRPLCQTKTISSLSGYIQCDNADVDLPCTQKERDEIASYMNGGFYYE